MAFYQLYSESTKCKYKTTICSKATIVICVINFFTFVVPFVLAYKTQGLWLKHDFYLEQPDVHFKYQYLIILTTEKIERPVICTTLTPLVDMSDEFNDCDLIKVREDDFNKDGLTDQIIFQTQASIDPLVNVLGVSVILIFNYKLYAHGLFEMESAGWLESFNPIGGSKFSATTDLRIKQRQPLRHKGRDLRFNTSIQFDEDLNMFNLLKSYSERNVTTRFENTYSAWSLGKSPEQPFEVLLSINIPEETILYTPGFWQTIKMAWVQYLALLYISTLISKRVKHFILDNRLVHNVKILPWKKYM